MLTDHPVCFSWITSEMILDDARILYFQGKGKRQFGFPPDAASLAFMRTYLICGEFNTFLFNSLHGDMVKQEKYCIPSDLNRKKNQFSIFAKQKFLILV